MARRLRWEPGNPLYDWQQRQRVASKPKPKKRSVKRMARRRRRSIVRYLTRRRGRSKKDITKTAFKYVRLGALVAPAAYEIWRSPDAHGVAGAIYDYTGYNIETGEFRWNQMLNGWSPFVAACLATYGIPKITGLFRKL